MVYKKVTLIGFRKLISFRDGKTYFSFFYEKNFQKNIFPKSIFRTSSETFKSGDFFENSARRGLHQYSSDYSFFFSDKNFLPQCRICRTAVKILPQQNLNMKISKPLIKKIAALRAAFDFLNIKRSNSLMGPSAENLPQLSRILPQFRPAVRQEKKNYNFTSQCSIKRTVNDP